jgi:hypothetical protein
MLTWLFELLTSFITFILSLFGINYKSKTVSFADEVDKKDEHTETPIVTPEETSVVTPTESTTITPDE